jgi:hypothetical protein
VYVGAGGMGGCTGLVPGCIDGACGTIAWDGRAEGFGVKEDERTASQHVSLSFCFCNCRVHYEPLCCVRFTEQSLLTGEGGSRVCVVGVTC